MKEFGNELKKMEFLFLLTCSILLHVALNKGMANIVDIGREGMLVNTQS